MIKLLLKFNGAVVKEFTIAAPEVTLGRKAENDVVIDNPAVSGRHCRVVREGTSYFVEDLKSTNGTFLRDRRVTKEPLHHKDEITIAKHTVEFFNDEEPAAIQSRPAEPVSSDATVVMAAAPPLPVAPGKIGHVRFLTGPKSEPLALTALTTYIGKSDQAAIKIKGLFAPDMAACIAKKPEGYVLTSLRDKLVKINGSPMDDQSSLPLNEGDLIDAGNLKMMFFLQTK